MKILKSLLILIALFISGNVYANGFQQANVDYEVCFTPGSNCTQDIVNAINEAKKQVLVQAYSFTSTPIARALMLAHRRGIDVRVILDKSQKTQKYSTATFFANQGIPAWIDYKPAIAHNKVMVIDDETVITGSFNFTSTAQKKNAENLIILRNAELAKIYAKNWHNRLAQSIAAADYKPVKKHKREIRRD